VIKVIGGLAVLALLAVGCTSDDDGADDASESEVSSDDGTWLRERQDDYLAFATTELQPSSALNVIANAERAARDGDFEFDAAAVTPESFERSFEKIDEFEDTADFDLLYLLNLWYGYRDVLSDDTRQAIEDRLIAFKYWYTDPTPEGIIDQRWYWSENHRVIFHTLEYLAGQAFPDTTFTSDGLTGAEHQERAGGFLDEWFDEKVDYGFSEWHSDVYYQKDVTPLLTLVEFADDPVVAEKAAMVLDLVLFDLALHLRAGNNGVTHGRSYMKDKSRATDQDVFGLAKLLFDQTTEPYQSTGDPGATLLARAQQYEVPSVIRAVAASTEPMIDKERMGVPIDVEQAPLEPDPPAPYDIAWDDPDNVAFWWERGALTAWQVVPLTLATADQYGLWETDFFKPFAGLRDITGGDPEVAQSLAHGLGRIINIGLLSEVDTYTYRSAHSMLSTAQDYRAGSYGHQYHAWQATLDEGAIVFTTHPASEPREGDRWVDADLYWSGTGSMPRSAQQGTAAIHLYAPQFASPDAPPLDAFSYLDYTHAYFPQERFDEIVQEGNWTFGRRGNGFVALWSWRATTWRSHDPDRVFTNGLTEPFDLVAEGGSDNVWIVEVGDIDRWSSFDEFREAVLAADVVVTERGQADDGVSLGFDVAYDSPTEGTLEFTWDGPLLVDGEEVAISDYPRFDNPFAQVPFGSKLVEIRHGDSMLRLDFENWARNVSG
jgi:hypothetical protein